MSDQEKIEEKESGRSFVTFKMLWNILRRCWYWLLLAALIVGGIVFAVGYSNYVPVYSSTSEFYVSNVANTTSLYSSSQTSGAEDMAEIICKFATADGVVEYISKDVEQYGYKVSGRAIKSMISTKSDSAFFTVTVTSTDPKLAYYIAQSMENVLPVYSDWCNNQYESHIYERESDGSIAYYEYNGNTYRLVREKKLEPFSDVMVKVNAEKAAKLEEAAKNNEVIEVHSSETIKITSLAAKDSSPDNTFSLFRYPVLAAFLAAVLLYLIFFLVALSDTTIYSVADLKARNDSFPVIGNIEHWSVEGEDKKKRRKVNKSKDGFRVDVDKKLLLRGSVPFRITEAFHELRTNITFCAAGESGCVVGVASSMAGSGKSFVMANLAVSLSNLPEKKILLVDADMRCPMIHKIFGLENKNGLSNLIAGQSKEANLNHFGSLDVLTSGTLPPNPIDLLSTSQMAQLIELWKKQYDYILMDLPPIGEVSDALVVSPFISGYIFVLRAGHSDIRVMNDATASMEEKDVKIYGYVLTDVDPENLDVYSKYGKYKSYSKYGKYYSYSKYGYSRSYYKKAAEDAAKDSKSNQDNQPNG